MKTSGVDVLPSTKKTQKNIMGGGGGGGGGGRGGGGGGQWVRFKTVRFESTTVQIEFLTQ